MYYHEETKAYFEVGKPFTLKGRNYPPKWLAMSSAKSKEALGLVPVKYVGVRQPEHTHFVTEERVGAEIRITSTPKPQSFLDQQTSSVMSHVIYRFNAVREIALGRLTGIAARAEWNSDKELAGKCYSAQGVLLGMKKDLPEDVQEAKAALLQRYAELRQELSLTESLSSVLPELSV